MSESQVALNTRIPSAIRDSQTEEITEMVRGARRDCSESIRAMHLNVIVLMRGWEGFLESYKMRRIEHKVYKLFSFEAHKFPKFRQRMHTLDKVSHLEVVSIY